MSSSANPKRNLYRPDVAIGDIEPSRTNRAIDDNSQGMQELVASIARYGVMQPITLRRLTDADGTVSRFELIAGERRFRAARRAGLTTIPAHILPEASDDEALARQITENIQREDLTSLQYAEQLKLLRDTGKTIDEIAAMVNKPAKRIYDILKQLELIQPARDAYQAGLIKPGHAILIARLPPAMQEKALRTVLSRFSAPSDSTPLGELVSRYAADEDFSPLPEKSLRRWIADNATLALKKVPWFLDDATLAPDAGACATCTKRSINDPAAWEDLAGKHDLCMDPPCHKRKMTAFLRTRTSEAKKAGRPLIRVSTSSSWTPAAADATTFKHGQWAAAKKGECEHIRSAIYCDGPDTGKVLSVCITPDCSVHGKNINSPARASAPVNNYMQAYQRIQADLCARQSILSHVMSEPLPLATADGLAAALRLLLVAAAMHAPTAFRGLANHHGWLSSESSEEEQVTYDILADAAMLATIPSGESRTALLLQVALTFSAAYQDHDDPPRITSTILGILSGIGYDADALVTRSSSEPEPSPTPES